MVGYCSSLLFSGAVQFESRLVPSLLTATPADDFDHLMYVSICFVKFSRNVGKIKGRDFTLRTRFWRDLVYIRIFYKTVC
jgi:hypothetical protein